MASPADASIQSSIQVFPQQPQDADSSRAENLKLQIKPPYKSKESGQAAPGIDIIDLTHTPTDTSPPEELQGFTIGELDTSNKGAADINLASNSTLFPLSIPTSNDPSSDSAATPTSPVSPRSIRFRSRVRITSGVHHKNPHRPVSSTKTDANVDSASSHPSGLVDASEADVTGSSLSSSPSSSISAPIRFREDESTASRWGPLGQRVRLFVSQQKTQPSPRYSFRGQEARSLVHGTDVNAGPSSSLTAVDSGSSRTHERTPLFGPQRQRQRQRQYKPNPVVDEDESLDDLETYNAHRARSNNEIDVVFGKWPGRLLNRHWWWWQMKPIVCCNYADDDEEL